MDLMAVKRLKLIVKDIEINEKKLRPSKLILMASVEKIL
jgi:hypothetical protein